MSKVHNGLLLILGVIVSYVGWIAIYPADPATDAAAQAVALRGDETLALVGLLMGFGGMLAMLIGLINFTRGMQTAAGPGSAYAGVSATLFGLVAAVVVVATGLEFSVLDASSAYFATTLMGTSLAIGNGIMLTLGTAMLLLGIAIVLAKNIHIVVGALAIPVGVVLLITPFMASDSPISMVAWIGLGITTLGIGILSIRSAD
jgi:hypothetical protein